MSRSTLVSLLLGAFLLGVGIGSLRNLPLLVAGFMGGGVVFILATSFKREGRARLGGVVLVLVALGMLRAYSAGLPPRGMPVSSEVNEFRARVVSVEQGRGGVKTLILEPAGAAHLILVRSPFLRGDFATHQEVRVRCQLVALDPNNRFEATRLSHGIVARCLRPRLASVWETTQPGLFDRLRERAVSLLDQKLPEPDDAFAASLLLGARQTLPDQLVVDFRKTGMSHIVAISGANVTLLVVLLSAALAWFLPRRPRLVIITLGIFFFVLLTGASAGTIRAGVMGVMTLLLIHLGRKTKPLPVILLVAAIMVVISPRLLVYDLSFQLSFLAIVGVLILAPYFERRFKNLPDFLGLKRYFVQTLGVLILITPFAWWKFRTLTPLALPANLLVLPMLPAVMGTGVATLMFGNVPYVGSTLAQALTFMLGLIRWIIHTLAGLG